MQPRKILTGVAKSQNAEMPKCRKSKAGILKPGITKIKHHTDKGWFTRTTQAQVRWPTTVTAKVIYHFYSQFYSLPNNFWFRQIDRDQKKPVSTIFIHNLEIISPTLFCLAEISLSSFDWIVVTLHRRALVTPPSPLMFPTLDQRFPCVMSMIFTN